MLGCLRAQSYEFESNSQQVNTHDLELNSCLRSQNYEFESNSQQHGFLATNGTVVWDHKITNLKAIHNITWAYHNWIRLFEITKLRIWKQLTTAVCYSLSKLLLFEVTKLRIWKQLTTTLPLTNFQPLLFEVTKLRI